LCELSERFNIEPVVERLHRQSAQVIKEIDACDKEFRHKFKEIRIRPIEDDAAPHVEQRRLDDEFKNSSTKKNNGQLEIRKRIKNRRVETATHSFEFDF
jgi:hypothetical protein